MRVVMRVFVLAFACVCRGVRLNVQMRMRIRMTVRMAVTSGLCMSMVGVGRRDILCGLSIHQHIYFGGLDTIAIHLREAKTGADSQRLRCLFESHL